jgi:hypothetical protein
VADAARPVEVHELVYGSAPKLLEPSAQDLGVIASTRGMSTEIARQLAYHRGYTLHTAAATAVKYVVGLLSGRLEVTRVEMVTDHTGRRIPFARHVLATLDPACGCGELIRRAVAHARSPREATAGWIEPAPRLGPVPPPTAASPAMAKAVASAAETVMQYPQTKRPVLLVQAPGGPQGPADPSLAFVAAVADVVPQSSLAALVAMTHVIESGDRDKLPEASLLATYPGTPFHAEMMSRTGGRRPLVIDIASLAVDGASEPASPFVKATVADVVAGRAGRFADLCDRLGAKPEHHQLVGALDAALARVERQPDIAGLDDFVGAVKKAGEKLNKDALGALAYETVANAVTLPSFAVIRDAARQSGGVERLGTLVALDESIQQGIVRLGVHALANGERSDAETIAAAVRAAGEEAVAVTQRVAAGSQGAKFRDLVKPPVVPAPAVAVSAGSTMAERMRKPERRQVNREPVNQTGKGYNVNQAGKGYGGGLPGGMPTGGATWLWYTLVLISVSLAAAGVGVPVWRCYEPPPAAAKDDSKTAKPADAHHVAQPSQQLIAIQTAFQMAWPKLMLPAALGLVTLLLIPLNGLLSSLMANLLPGSLGRWAAGLIPLIVMLGVSGIGFLSGLRDEDKKGQNPSRATAAAAPDKGTSDKGTSDKAAEGESQK